MRNQSFYISFLGLIFSINTSFSQSLLSAGGFSISNINYSVDFSIGEIAVNFISANNSIFSIGYIQPTFKAVEIAPTILPIIQVKDNNLIVYQFMSPNNDGKNETFYVNNLENYPYNEVIIMDRIGKIVFHQKGYANDWTADGMPEDNYFYVVKIPTINTELKGGLVLAR